MNNTFRSGVSKILKLALGATAFTAMSGFGWNSSMAQESNWTNIAGGNFNDAANWDSGVPNASSNANFSISGLYQVDVDQTSSVQNLTVDAGDVSFSGSKTLSAARSRILNSKITFANGINFKNTASIFVEGDGDVASFALKSGATGSAAALLLRGMSSGTIEANITGAGSRLTLTEGMSIGAEDGETASLTVSSGGSLESRGFNIIGGSSNDNGNVDITGTGSSWTLSRVDFDSVLQVGASGSGWLNVNDGGQVSGADILVVGAIGNGVATVSGDGSMLDSVQGFIGRGGNGTLRVLDGGSAQIDESTSVGSFPGSQGLIDVAGQGANRSQLTTSNLYLGTNDGVILGGTGTLQVDGDGIVQVGDDAAFASSGSGLSIGDSTTGGNLSIRNGSNAEIASDTYIGRNNGFSGLVNVSGSGSELNGSGTTTLSVGNAGEGALQVHDGGSVTYSRLEVGQSSTGEGTVSIDDATLEFGDAKVGSINGGLATIDINNGGEMFGDSLTIEGSSANQVELSGLFSNLQVDSLNVKGGALNINSSTFANASETLIEGTGSVFVAGGFFDSGLIDRSSFDRISGTSGSVAGNLKLSGFTNINDLEELAIENLDTSNFRFGNTGVVFGNGVSTEGIDNRHDGEIRVNNGQWQRWGSGNSNAGEIVVTEGTLEFGGNFQNRGQFYSDTDTGSINLFEGTLRVESNLFNDTNAFIGGRGRIIAGGGITNRGVMAFSSGNLDIIGDVDNIPNGQIITSGNGTTTFFDDVVHNGTEIRTSEGSSTVFFGSVSGSGNFTGTGDVFFEGDLRPGNSPDVVSFEGDVLFSSSLTSSFELAGLALGEFDKLEIAGDLNIAGNLNIDLIDGFSLGFGDEFLIAEVAGDVSGQFVGLSEGGLIGNYGGTDLFITYAGGNGNDVGLFTAVPEPSSAAIVGLLLIGLVSTRRRA